MPTTSNNSDLQRVGECLYRAQKSKIYYAIIKRGGKQIKRSLKTTDQALAKRRLSELVEKAAVFSRSENREVSLSGLGVRWLGVFGSAMNPSSKKRQEGIVEKLVSYFGEIQVRHITRTMVEDWAAAESKKVEARTFNYERETFVRLLDYAVREGLILDNPVRVIQRHKVRTHRPEIPTKEPFKTMLETIATLRADAMPSIDLCELLAYSGCRLNEATALTWVDIDFEQKRFTVTGGDTGTKNHEARVVPLFSSLETLLKRMLDRYSESPALSVPVVSINGSWTAMISACRRADLPQFSHHHLRQFSAAMPLRQGLILKR